MSWLRTIAGDQATAEVREAWETYRAKLGFTDEDIFDIAEVASMFNLTNRLTSALGMQPNPEFHTMGR